MNELQLLKGSPIEVESFKVYPLTLEEIVNIGEEKYNLYIQSLSLTKADIDKSFINPELWTEFLKMDDFQFLILFIYQNQEIQEIILSSLSLFLRESVKVNLEDGLFIERDNENFIISKDIFNRIKEIVSEQNFIKKAQKEEESKPYNDKARELIEKRNKYRKMVQQQNAEDGLNLSDIISIVATHSPNINFFNVWDLTVYNLYTIYIRMAMKDNYETQIYLLPHSSSENKPDLKHWMSKINKNN